MADVTLKDGREVNVDLSLITIGEYRSIFSPEAKPEDSDPLLAKVTGLKLEEVQALPYTDYRSLAKAFLKAAAKPDPS